MLHDLCNTHPDIRLTFEFGNFIGLNKPYTEYRQRIQRRFWINRPDQITPYANVTGSPPLSLFFGLGYLFLLGRYHDPQSSNFRMVEKTLATLWRSKKIIGDKYPRYVFLLDELSDFPDLSRVVIYRDCRDIVVSVKRQLEGHWQGASWAERQFGTVDGIARRWVQAIESMEAHSASCHQIRYEDLVANPASEIRRLGTWLGVDPDKFDVTQVHSNSVHRYRDHLSDEELETILEVTGPTLSRLGYL
jgi:hypothetical protein